MRSLVQMVLDSPEYQQRIEEGIEGEPDRPPQVQRGGRRAVMPVGKRFGNLVVVEPYVRSSPSGKAMALCRCDCGEEKAVISVNLRQGRATTCGCGRKARAT